MTELERARDLASNIAANLEGDLSNLTRSQMLHKLEIIRIVIVALREHLNQTLAVIENPDRLKELKR